MTIPDGTTAIPAAPDRFAAVPLMFEDFFHDQRDRLFASLCVVTGNRHDAEELAQDAFLKMWERWDRQGAIDDPVAYLYRVAMNGFRRRLRRAEIARRLTRVHVEVVTAAPDEAVLLDEALRSLTPRQRAALVLTELVGFTAGEAAEALGVKPSTIGALKYQGRAALRDNEEYPDV